MVSSKQMQFLILQLAVAAVIYISSIERGRFIGNNLTAVNEGNNHRTEDDDDNRRTEDDDDNLTTEDDDDNLTTEDEDDNLTTEDEDDRSISSDIEKKDNAAAPRTTTTNLWLLQCETRVNDELLTWKFSAKHVQERASNDLSVNVRIASICENSTFTRARGFAMKIETVTEFVRNLVNQTEASTTNHEEEDIVILTDSDTIFNAWGVTAKEAVERFHHARQGRGVLISAEPTCWNGSFCNEGALYELYGNVTASYCPQFVCAGQYMGYAKDLLNMFESEEMTLWKRQGRVDDQHMLTNWYGNNRANAILDSKSIVFRNLGTGFIDIRVPHVNTTQKRIFTCGPGERIRNCGVYNTPYTGVVNETNLQLEMTLIPNCTETSQSPFSIHGSGPTKRIFRQISRPIAELALGNH